MLVAKSATTYGDLPDCWVHDKSNPSMVMPDYSITNVSYVS